MIGSARPSGFIMASLLITTTLVLLIGTVVAQLVVNNFLLATADVARFHSQTAADAGLDYGVANLNVDNSWTGTGGETELLNNGDVRTTYEVSVADGSVSDQKIITSTGRSYTPSSSTVPKNERTYEVLVEGLAPSSGSYSLVTGVGGLFMENNSKIVAGDIYVNGEIDMQNSAQIGLSSGSVTVKAAHQNCPLGGGTDYPLVCGPGNGQPIGIANSAHIYAEVQATNQTDGSSMTNPGLVAGAPEPQALPDHARETQKANVSTTTSSSYYTLCDQNDTTRTWPGRLKIEGDVEISHSCRIIVEGDVWISGNLIMKNSAQIEVSGTVALGGQNTVNANLPTIMVDGPSGVLMENSSQTVANADDVGAQFITYWSKASCSPDCADVTGNELFDSRNEVTLLLKNNAKAPESILYARWTQAQLDNAGDIGAIVGQTVKLQNSATITFGTSVGSGGSPAPNTFVIRDYRRIF